MNTKNIQTLREMIISEINLDAEKNLKDSGEEISPEFLTEIKKWNSDVVNITIDKINQKLCQLGNEDHEQAALNSLFFDDKFEPCDCADDLNLENEIKNC
ncbi:MAG: hypothetical protein AD073_000023 [Mycoplasmataceae bacterium]|nr:MAG: hypothetical protein AD073_000023 [Mycoplasmataceae bacterium]